MSSKLNTINIHFILCTERSGSSLLSLMLNLNTQIISPSEEPFAVYFYDRYKHKVVWTDLELIEFIDEFWLVAEKNLELFFTTKEKLLAVLSTYKQQLPYQHLVKLIYLQFIEPKDKAEVTVIVDKQIKYFFHLPVLIKIFPDAKFIILVRDVRDNIISKSNRNLNNGSNPVYLAALWKNTYDQIKHLQKANKAVLVIKYEDLIMESKLTLQKICQFIDVNFQESMLNTGGVYKQFLDIKGSSTNLSEIARLETFQSNLFKPINASHIGSYKENINLKLLSKIEKLNQSLFMLFGYKVSNTSNALYSINDYWQITKAYLYRPLLLKFYLMIPLSIKIMIKKLRS